MKNSIPDQNGKPFLFTKSHNRKAVKALLNNSARKSKRNRLDHVHCSPQQNQIEPRADPGSSCTGFPADGGSLIFFQYRKR
jgi:hypothetical protein